MNLDHTIKRSAWCNQVPHLEKVIAKTRLFFADATKIRIFNLIRKTSEEQLEVTMKDLKKITEELDLSLVTEVIKNLEWDHSIALASVHELRGLATKKSAEYGAWKKFVHEYQKYCHQNQIPTKLLNKYQKQVDEAKIKQNMAVRAANRQAKVLGCIASDIGAYKGILEAMEDKDGYSSSDSKNLSG